MGGATEAEAYAMAELLMWDWFGKYCDDVPDATWLRMIDESVLTTRNHSSFTLRYGMATKLRLVPALSPAGQRIAEGIRKEHQIIAAFKAAALQTIREQRANERSTK